MLPPVLGQLPDLLEIISVNSYPSSQPRHVGFGHPVAGPWGTASWRGAEGG